MNVFSVIQNKNFARTGNSSERIIDRKLHPERGALQRRAHLDIRGWRKKIENNRRNFSRERSSGYQSRIQSRLLPKQHEYRTNNFATSNHRNHHHHNNNHINVQTTRVRQHKKKSTNQRSNPQTRRQSHNSTPKLRNLKHSERRRWTALAQEQSRRRPIQRSLQQNSIPANNYISNNNINRHVSPNHVNPQQLYSSSLVLPLIAIETTRRRENKNKKKQLIVLEYSRWYHEPRLKKKRDIKSY